jgi:hypothetical protein
MQDLLCEKCRTSLNNALNLDVTVSVPVALDWTSFRSRIQGLLTSNECPARRELDSMRVCLDSAKSKVRSIQDQLRVLERRRVELEREKEGLEREQEDLEGYIEDQRGLLTTLSIRKLPSEVLTRVFGMCVEDAVSGKEWDNPLSVRSVRWVIGYVCRRWREISLDMPELWNNIQVILDEGLPSSDAFTPQSLLLGLHLDRAKHLPLTIGLFTTSYTADLKPNHPFLNRLIPTARRWARLNLAMSPRLIQRCLFEVKPFLAQTLVSFNTSMTKEWDTDNSVCDVLEDAVMLREVVLRYDIASMILRWDRIHSLTLFFDASSLDDVLSTLFQTRNLQKLQITYSSLSVVTEEEWVGVDFAPVTLPVLHTLRLERLVRLRGSQLEPMVVEECSAIYQLLNTLVLPSLEIFTENSESHTVALPVVASLLHRSRCQESLRHFGSSATIIEDQILWFGHEYAKLKVLELRGVETLTNRVIKLMTCRQQQIPSCTLPYLERLVLEGTMSFDARLFVEMVESRMVASRLGQDVGRMKEVKLEWTEDMFPMDIGVLERFSEDEVFRGLEFNVLLS